MTKFFHVSLQMLIIAMPCKRDVSEWLVFHILLKLSLYGYWKSELIPICSEWIEKRFKL